MTKAPEKSPAPFPSATFRGVGIICAAQLLAVFGEHIFLFNGLPLWAYDHLGGRSGVSLALAAVTLPALASYPAGLIAGRFAPRRTLLTCAAVRTVLSLLLLLGTLFAVEATGVYNAALLLFFTAAISLTDSFFMPVLKAALPLWSGEQEAARARANALMEAADVPGFLLGPGVAVLLYQRSKGSLSIVDATFAATYLLAFVFLLFLPKHRVPEKRDVCTPTSLQGTSSTVTSSWHQAAPLLGVWTSSMFVLGMTQALALPFVRETLRGSEAIYGILATIFGVGITVGASATSLAAVLRLSPLQRVTLFLLFAGTGLCLTAGNGTLLAAGVGWLFGGAGFAGVTVTMTTYLQGAAAQTKRAGLIGLTHSLEAAGVALGSIVSASTSYYVGIRGALAIGGLILIVGAGATYLARNKTAARHPAEPDLT